MIERKIFDSVTLVLNKGNTPIVYLDKRQCFCRDIGDTVFPLRKVVYIYEQAQKKHVFMGMMHQYALFMENRRLAEMTQDEIAKYDSTYIKTAKTFWTKEPYSYFERGWVCLAHPVRKTVTIHGSILFVGGEETDE